MDPAGNVSGAPYNFEFNTVCLGNYYNDSRLPFIWTIKYLTESGRIYQERIGDETLRDYSRMKIYFYKQVPDAQTRTNLAATIAGGNPNVSLDPIVRAGNTALPGEAIYGIRLECTGYSCLVTDDIDGIDIRYYSQRPAAISVSGPQLLCRSTQYPISASAVLGATSYLWTGSAGVAVIGVSGNNATLDLSNVPAGTNSVTVRVAAQDNVRCGGTTSPTRDLTLTLAPSPAALQNMQLSNGLCPTTSSTDKSVSVTAPSGVGNPTNYLWTISGAGAYFASQNGANTNLPTTVIKTPNVGSVTIGVSAKIDNCGGYSPLYSKTFQIGGLTPVCLQPTVVQDGCSPQLLKLVFETMPSGLNYYPGSIRNVSNGSTLTVLPQNQQGAPVFDVSVSSNTFVNGSYSFDLDYYIQSPCPPVGSTGFTTCTVRVNIGRFSGICDGLTGHVGTAPTPEGLKTQLYPNPTSGVVEIQVDKATQYQWVKVTDAQGTLRYEQHDPTSKGIHTLDLKALTPGVYLVQLYDGKQLVTRHLTKQ